MRSRPRPATIATNSPTRTSGGTSSRGDTSPPHRRRSRDSPLDITQLILDDHHEQRRLFAIVDQIDDADVEHLGLVWQRLATFLEVHAEAEEQLFYPALLHRGRGAGDKSSATDETEDAIKDHNEIRDAVAAVAKQKVGSKAWRKAVA